MMTVTRLEPYPGLTALHDLLRDRYPYMASAVGNNLDAFGVEWAEDIEDLLRIMAPTAGELERAVEGYVRYSLAVIKRQVLFDVDGGYPDKRFLEIAAEFYKDAGYIESRHLPGLLLSRYLWSKHYSQGRFFASTFIQDMIARKATDFIDAGTGTGLLSRRILTAMPGITGIGFDVSPACKRFAEDHAARFQVGERYEVQVADLSLATPAVQSDWLVSAEVLAHLEEPTDFLLQLRRMLRPGGKGYITATINAAEVDHIYLYHHPGEVKELLATVGFGVEQYQSVAAYKPRDADLAPPEVVAFIVT